MYTKMLRRRHCGRLLQGPLFPYSQESLIAGLANRSSHRCEAKSAEPIDMYGPTTMHTLLALVILATVAVPVLTEAAGRVSEVWALPDATSRMEATRHAVLFSLLGMAAALTALVVSQGADAASYKRWNLPPGYGYNTQANPNYGFGPIQKIHPYDVVSGDRIIGRDPDPFIRGQLLREYNSGRN
jgi:hypothetical protein